MNSPRIFDSLGDAIVTTDAIGVIESISPGAERLFDYAGAELSGQNMCVLLPEPYRTQHLTHMRQYRWTGHPQILRIGRVMRGRRKEGSTFPMHLSVRKHETNGNLHFAVIDLTRPEQREVESTQGTAAVDLNHVIIDLMDTLRRTLGDRVILSTSLAVDLWRVCIDPRAIEAAILNLASSAREVMRERGRLLIETRNFSGAAHGCDFPPGNYVRISVSSMGARTPASSATDLTKMQLVFKRLGGSIATEFDLRTVDQIVTGLGGHVTIDSGVGPDTTTHFHFPRVDNPSSEAFDTRSRD